MEFDLSYVTTAQARYETDVNDRVEAYLASADGVTVLARFGGTDLTSQASDNGFTIEVDNVATAFGLAEHLETIVGEKVATFFYDVDDDDLTAFAL